MIQIPQITGQETLTTQKQLSNIRSYLFKLANEANREQRVTSGQILELQKKVEEQGKEIAKLKLGKK